MTVKYETENLDDVVRLSVFADIGIGIAASKAINQAMMQVMEDIGNRFSPMTWVLMLLDRDTDELFFKFVAGKSAEKLGDQRIPKDQGIPGWVLEHGEATASWDASLDERISRKITALLGYTVQSVLAVPLKIDGSIVGVVYLINRTDETVYTNKDIEPLTSITDYAAVTIEKVYYLSALKDMVNMDPLTGVFNRRSFDNHLAKESERCRRYGHQVALLLLDIDGLGNINSEQGYSAGDKVFKDLTRLMRDNARMIDIIARFSGGRFAILLPHTQENEAEVVRRRILGDIKQQNMRGKGIPYSVSIGLVATGPDRVDELVLLASEELERQKADRPVKPTNST
jgi:diguanylate cyclase (GGDEF)-like protein